MYYITLFVFLIACEKEFYTSYGYDSPIYKNSKGLVFADVSQSFDRIYLTGFISLSEGEVEVKLLDPNGFAVYSDTLLGPIDMQINETFQASPGYWKLKK